MGAYSFKNVNAALVGPGVALALGSNSGVAKEGIAVEMIEDKDDMKVGADGSIMHSLRAGNAAKVMIRLLKTSIFNNGLSVAYNFQRQNPAAWGQNTLVVTDVVRGDVVSLSQVAFARQPSVTWAEDGNMNEWTFYGSLDEELLGVGVPDVNT